jgi:hypothetical protein
MCLYVCASCRQGRFWNRLKEPCKILLDVAVRHADGEARREEYKAAIQAVSRMNRRDKRAGGEDGPPLFGQAILLFLRLEHLPGWEGEAPAVEEFNYLGEEARRRREELRRQGVEVITEERAVWVQKEHDAFQRDHVNFLRDLFGNPFRPVSIDPTWLAWNGSTVRKLAQSLYEEYAFDRLAILADALEDAGCTDAGILEHCRGPGPHVRGCWVLDLLLGKQ